MNLQNQVKTLEQQLSVLSQTASEPNESIAGHHPEAHREKLEMVLKEVAQTKVRLMGENTQLRRQFREASQRVLLLSELLKADYRLYRTHETHFRLLAPLSRQMCCEVNSYALKRMHAFESKLPETITTGAMAGWRGTRFVEGGLFKFALDKKYRRVNTQKVLAQTWSSIVEPMKLEKLYPAALEMNVRLVQKIDDDNYVFLEETRSVDPSDHGARVKSAILVSRFKTSTGYRLLSQNLDRRYIELEERTTGETVVLHHELWVPDEQLVWVDLDAVDNETVAIKFGGIVSAIGSNAYFWMSEIVPLCMRYEMGTFGPRFSVPT